MRPLLIPLFLSLLLLSAAQGDADLNESATAVDGNTSIVKESSSIPSDDRQSVGLIDADTQQIAKPLNSEQLNALEKTYGIQFVLDPAVSSESGLKLLPDELNLEVVLQLLLKDYDYFLLYSSDDGKTPNRIKMVWIFPRSNGSEMQIISKALNSSVGNTETTLQYEKQLHQDESTTDTQTDTLKKLEDAISSGDENNWNDALQSAIQGGLALPQQQLEEMYVNAASEHVRADILSTIKLLPELDPVEIRRLTDIALQDSSPIIRDMALELQKSMFPQESVQPDPVITPELPDASIQK